MRKEELEIIITPDGEVKITTHGIKGPKCVDAAKRIQKALGPVTSQELTPEYYETEGQVGEQQRTRL